MRPSLQCLLFGSAALVALWIALEQLPSLFLINRTASMPVGLYLRSQGPISLDAIVTVAIPDVARDYAAERGASAAFRLLKRIVATEGNIVCADGAQILLDGEVLAVRSARDSNGRSLPSWTGCRQLSVDEYFVLGDSRDSFDSRYFGVVNASDIEGVWQPIFPTKH